MSQPESDLDESAILIALDLVRAGGLDAIADQLRLIVKREVRRRRRRAKRIARKAAADQLATELVDKFAGLVEDIDRERSEFFQELTRSSMLRQIEALEAPHRKFRP